jgi:hypothetical protein
VRVRNLADLARLQYSSGVTVDLSDPHCFSSDMSDGLGAFDVNWQASNKTLGARWLTGLQDPDTPIVSFEILYSTSRSIASSAVFRSIGIRSWFSFAGLSLLPNTTYYVAVRATNAVGRRNICITNGVQIDQTQPAPVYAKFLKPLSARSDGIARYYQWEADRLTMAWTDDQSGLLSYSYTVYSASDRIVLPETPADLLEVLHASEISL